MPSAIFQRRSLRRLAAVSVFAVMLLGVGFRCLPAIAQAERQAVAAQPAPPAIKTQPDMDTTWRKLPIDAGQKKNRFKVREILRNGKFALGEEKILADYYRRYVLPGWSHLANLTRLPDFRKDLRNDLMTGRIGGPPHDGLANIVMNYLSKMAAANNIHPAARVNAMLMVGELNDKEPAGISAPPVAMSAALPVLIAAVNNPAQIDAVRIAALIGIIRHVKFGALTPADRAAITAAMLKLAGTKTIPPGRSDAGHAWMRSLAAKALGLLGDPAGGVAKGLAAVAADSKAPLSARCEAANALGQLRYRGFAGVNPSAMAAALAKLVVDAVPAEGNPLSRPRLKYRLHCAWKGLTGVPDDDQRQGLESLAKAEPDHRAFVVRLKKAMQLTLDPFEIPNLDDEGLAEEIEEGRGELQELLKKRPGKRRAG